MKFAVSSCAYSMFAFKCANWMSKSIFNGIYACIWDPFETTSNSSIMDQSIRMFKHSKPKHAN